MLRELRLCRFRAFQDFRVSFGEGAYLVGPNNAGKSTILTALRVADVLLRLARRRNPPEVKIHSDRQLPAWPMSLVDFPALRESVRHEFRDEEASIELTWKNTARLVGVWPQNGDEESDDPFFYLERKPGMPVRTANHARDDFSPLGTVPILSPIDHNEKLLDDRYVDRHVSGRLSSRHFRNQLRMLRDKGTLEDFLDFAEPWLDGIRIEELGQHFESGGAVLDVYYTEPKSRIPKELVWAGDGIQVWLQLLYHIYRVRGTPTIILDEPEVYLHPDLQRRLVHVLESTGKQIILATHSSELVAEVSPPLVALVEKTRARARRAKDEATLESLSSCLGTAFNLRLARALRSRVVLFVEGRDMVIIRKFAKALKLSNLEAERNMTIVKLEGFTKSEHVAPFTWLCEEVLSESIKPFVLLDRDYRGDKSLVDLEKKFREARIEIHVWRRKELESYLLTPTVIARLSGMTTSEVEKLLDSIILGMEADVFGRLLNERISEEVGASRHSVNVTSQFKTEFDNSWGDSEFRLHHAPPKLVISRLNEALQAQGKKPISARSLANAHRLNEIDPEMQSALRRIEEAVTVDQ